MDLRLSSSETKGFKTQTAAMWALGVELKLTALPASPTTTMLLRFSYLYYGTGADCFTI